MKYLTRLRWTSHANLIALLVHELGEGHKFQWLNELAFLCGVRDDGIHNRVRRLLAHTAKIFRLV